MQDSSGRRKMSEESTTGRPSPLSTVTIGPTVTRRRVLLSGLMIGSVLVAGQRSGRAALALSSPPPPIRFDVFRAGDAIGSHEVDFGTVEAGLTVGTRIDIELRVLGVRVFEFRHKSAELWGGDRLQKFDSETLDEDRRFFVTGYATSAGFKITHRKGSDLAPADIMVGSYWRPEIARQRLLIDPQRGTLKEQQLLGKDRVTIPVGRASVQATRYTVTGLTNGWVAYDNRGRWLSAELKAKGSDILYRLRD
jgi:uncharacterized protein DUF6134